jgi:hypothetical protein
MGIRPWLVLASTAWLACGGDPVVTPPDAPPLPDATPVTCDTVAQECLTHGNASLDKCTLQQIAGQLVTRCTTAIDDLGAGKACERRAGGPGFDDCGIGFYCTGRTLPSDDTGFPLRFVCRTFCRADDACAAGERCTAIGANVPQDGLCLPAGCSFFDQRCGAGATCDPAVLVDRATYVGLCRTYGAAPLAVGASCSGIGICGANAFCGPNAARTDLVCIAECDDEHPCAQGATCQPFSGLPAHAGECL